MDPVSGRLVGQTISHYRVLAHLGSGGMGIVYRGEDVRLGRPVAIKFVADDFAHDPQAVARLRAEARAASALSHPGICTIYDIGTADGRPFIVMELMEGQTLRERLGQTRLRLDDVIAIGIEIADALQSAHAAGIIHRDIKPANIFLTARGQVKLLDFGLAKLTAQQAGADSTTVGSGLTQAGTTLGTVAYMSPEQASGEELDGRTDLFSLGVVLYECATGRQPFEGKTHALILSAILNQPPLPPTIFNPELPGRLEEIVLTCLEKSRELRYQSATDLCNDLTRVRRDLESGRLQVGDRTVVTMSPSGQIVTVPRRRVQSSSARQSGDAGGRRRPRLLIAAGAAAAAIALLAAGNLVIGRRTPVAEPRSGAAASAIATPVEDPIANSLAQAESNLAAGNYRAAISSAAEVLAVQPEHVRALDIRTRAAAALERFDRAIALTEQRLAENDLQGAAAALADAREIEPASPTVSGLAAALAARLRAPADVPTRPPRERPPAQAPEVTARAAPPEPRPPQPSQPPDATASRSSSPSQPEPSSTPPPSAPPAAREPIAPPAAPPPDTAAAASGSAPSATTAPAPASGSSPPPAVASPPPATPPERSAGAAAPQPADDDAAIRRVVASYARAIERKDIALFRSVKPNLSQAEEQRLQQGFRAVTAQQVTITPLSITVREREAVVVARRRDVIDAGGRRQTLDSQQTFQLMRSPAGWVITEIR